MINLFNKYFKINRYFCINKSNNHLKNLIDFDSNEKSELLSTPKWMKFFKNESTIDYNIEKGVKTIEDYDILNKYISYNISKISVEELIISFNYVHYNEKKKLINELVDRIFENKGKIILNKYYIFEFFKNFEFNNEDFIIGNIKYLFIDLLSEEYSSFTNQEKIHYIFLITKLNIIKDNYITEFYEIINNLLDDEGLFEEFFDDIKYFDYIFFVLKITYPVLKSDLFIIENYEWLLVWFEKLYFLKFSKQDDLNDFFVFKLNNDYLPLKINNLINNFNLKIMNEVHNDEYDYIFNKNKCIIYLKKLLLDFEYKDRNIVISLFNQIIYHFSIHNVKVEIEYLYFSIKICEKFNYINYSLIIDFIEYFKINSLYNEINILNVFFKLEFDKTMLKKNISKDILIDYNLLLESYIKIINTNFQKRYYNIFIYELNKQINCQNDNSFILNTNHFNREKYYKLYNSEISPYLYKNKNNFILKSYINLNRYIQDIHLDKLESKDFYNLNKFKLFPYNKKLDIKKYSTIIESLVIYLTLGSKNKSYYLKDISNLFNEHTHEYLINNYGFYDNILENFCLLEKFNKEILNTTLANNLVSINEEIAYFFKNKSTMEILNILNSELEKNNYNNYLKNDIFIDNFYIMDHYFSYENNFNLEEFNKTNDNILKYKLISTYTDDFKLLDNDGNINVRGLLYQLVNNKELNKIINPSKTIIFFENFLKENNIIYEKNIIDYPFVYDFKIFLHDKPIIVNIFEILPISQNTDNNILTISSKSLKYTNLTKKKLKYINLSLKCIMNILDSTGPDLISELESIAKF